MASILLAVGDKAALTTGDTAINNRLATTLGHTVTLMSDEEAVPVGTFDLIVLCTSGTSGNYSTKFTDLTTPVFTLNAGGMLTQLSMSSTNSGTFTGTFTQMDLVSTDSINTGIPDPLTFYSVAHGNRGVVAANVASGVTVLALNLSDTTRASAGYAESGAAAVSGTFTGRRAFLDTVDTQIADLTADAWTWFDHFITRLLTAPPPPALSVTVSSDVTSITTSGTANLTATAAGGTSPYTYAWTVTSGPAATFGTPTAATTTFTPTGGAGTYVLRCTVTDSVSATAYGEVTVTAGAPNDCWVMASGIWVSAKFHVRVAGAWN